MKIIGNGNGSILERGLDILRDPAVTKSAKIAAVAVIAIGVVALLGKAAMDSMGRCD